MEDGCRHALDFRLMSERRVAILDASHSLFLSGAGETSSSESTLILQPIPGFAEIIQDAIREVMTFGISGKVVSVDVGVVCDAESVGGVGRAIHDRVLTRLEGNG